MKYTEKTEEEPESVHPRLNCEAGPASSQSTDSEQNRKQQNSKSWISPSTL